MSQSNSHWLIFVVHLEGEPKGYIVIFNINWWSAREFM